MGGHRSSACGSVSDALARSPRDGRLGGDASRTRAPADASASPPLPASLKIRCVTTRTRPSRCIRIAPPSRASLNNGRIATRLRPAGCVRVAMALTASATDGIGCLATGAIRADALASPSPNHIAEDRMRSPRSVLRCARIAQLHRPDRRRADGSRVPPPADAFASHRADRTTEAQTPRHPRHSRRPVRIATASTRSATSGWVKGPSYRCVRIAQR